MIREKDLSTIVANIVLTIKDGATVEEISDTTEKKLMEFGFLDVAKAFIVYRENRRQAREATDDGAYSDISVIKNDGKLESFNLSKIRDTLNRVSAGLNVNINLLERTVLKNIYDGIKTSDIIKAAVLSATSLSPNHVDYDKVAARLFRLSIYKEVFGTSVKRSKIEEKYKQSFIHNVKHLTSSGVLKKGFEKFDLNKLANAIRPERDELFEFTGISTTYEKYLIKDKEIGAMETPQAFWMRVAMGIVVNEKENIDDLAIEHYEILSKFDGINSTPTLFYSGMSRSQMASCGGYVVDDNLESIMGNGDKHALLSKWSYGLGFSMSKIRAIGSRVSSTGITSGGLIPFIKIYNSITESINRSGRKRGAAAVYIEPWHFEVESFLDLRKNTGDERLRAHGLNLALWIPDEFMKRVLNDDNWYLLDPGEFPELADLYGKNFSERYNEIVKMFKDDPSSVKICKEVKASDLWKRMLSSLFQTGYPWITFKDAANVRNNAKHDGIVYSSNLCVSGDTQIEVKIDGQEKTMNIKDAVNLLKNKEIEVLSMNTETGEKSFKKITNGAMTNKKAKVLKIIDEEGNSLTCTPEHKIYTKNRGYVMAKDLVEDELEVISSSEEISVYDLDELEEEIEVYDITVEDNHNFYANNILIHNCTEITLPTSADREMFNCFLASVNLSNIYNESFDDKIDWEKLKHVSKVLTKRLDFAQGEFVGSLGVSRKGYCASFPTNAKLDVEVNGKRLKIYAFEFEEGMKLLVEGKYKLVDVDYKPYFIENNFYPTKEALLGAMKGRPNGLGMMGWQDLLFKLNLPFDSDEATKLLDKITEYISYYSYEASSELAEQKGKCPIFDGSLPSQGLLPIDTLELLEKERGIDIKVNREYNLDWDALRDKIKKHGLRNLWVMAPAPTATISTVVGTYPGIEPQYANMYVKENMSGTFTILNKYLVEALEKIGLWTTEMKNKIKKENGRISNIDEIPDEIKNVFKDAFEVDHLKYVEQGAVMSKWIDQSHSRNFFVDQPNGRLLNAIYMGAWQSGMKTTYYLRSKSATNNNG